MNVKYFVLILLLGECSPERTSTCAADGSKKGRKKKSKMAEKLARVDEVEAETLRRLEEMRVERETWERHGNEDLSRDIIGIYGMTRVCPIN